MDLRLPLQRSEQHERSCKLKHIVILTHNAVWRVANLLWGRPHGERRTRTKMLFVIRICLLYLQTVLITTGPGATNRMQVSNMFTVNFMFGLLKSNSWRLESISCNRNELKQCINTRQITKMSNSTWQHADNSGYHADP